VKGGTTNNYKVLSFPYNSRAAKRDVVGSILGETESLGNRCSNLGPLKPRFLSTTLKTSSFPCLTSMFSSRRAVSDCYWLLFDYSDIVFPWCMYSPKPQTLNELRNQNIRRRCWSNLTHISRYVNFSIVNVFDMDFHISRYVNVWQMFTYRDMLQSTFTYRDMWNNSCVNLC
jgi:hypothetical protein